MMSPQSLVFHDALAIQGYPLFSYTYMSDCDLQRAGTRLTQVTVKGLSWKGS